MSKVNLFRGSLAYQLLQLAIAIDNVVFDLVSGNFLIALCEELTRTFNFGFSTARNSVDDIEPLVSAIK